MGLVLGSRKKDVVASLSLLTAFNTSERRSLWGESMANRWVKVGAR